MNLTTKRREDRAGGPHTPQWDFSRQPLASARCHRLSWWRYVTPCGEPHIPTSTMKCRLDRLEERSLGLALTNVQGERVLSTLHIGDDRCRTDIADNPEQHVVIADDELALRKHMGGFRTTPPDWKNMTGPPSSPSQRWLQLPRRLRQHPAAPVAGHATTSLEEPSGLVL